MTEINLSSEVNAQVRSLPEFRTLSEEELDQVAGGILPALAIAFTLGLAVGSLAAIWQGAQQR